MTRRDDAKRCDESDQPMLSTATSIRTSTRALGIALALALVGVALTPTVAAETSSRTVCLGDTGQTDSPLDAGTGCATGTIQTDAACSGSANNYDCKLLGRLFVDVEGPQTCGTTNSSWFGDAALTCVDVIDSLQPSTSDATDWEVIATYDDVPPEGITVEVPWDVCVWADRSDPAQTFCDGPDKPGDHVHHIAGPPGSGSGLDVVQGQIDYATATVENTEAPVGVSP